MPFMRFVREPLLDTFPTKILIVDDRPENLVALHAALQDTGYKLIEAHSGKEALEEVRRHDFAVILLDVQMPGMDGFEAATRIRSESRSSATPIIFVTAIHRDEQYEYMGYVAGAVDYIFKPVNIEILKAKLSVFAELHRKNVELKLKNQENLRQADLLKQAALKDQEHALLKSAIEARDEFLSMASHELKTPITPLNLQMQAFIKMYRDGSIENVEKERLLRLLETSQSQIDRISRLVSDLVDVSRIKTGRLELRRENVDLRHLVEGVLSAFAEETKKVECEIRLDAEAAVFGNWDQFRIEQVVINLLSNAMKYGPGKPIDVSVRSHGKKASIAIRDQGIGIAPEDHKRIFERFERAVSPRHYGGLGLGLFIANRIVLLHGGNILVESSLEEGAQFTVELPK